MYSQKLITILLFLASSTTWASLSTNEDRPGFITRGVDRVDLRPHINFEGTSADSRTETRSPGHVTKPIFINAGKEGLIIPAGTSVLLMQNSGSTCVIDNNAEASSEILRLSNCSADQAVQIQAIVNNSNNVQATDTGVVYQMADIGVVRVITSEPIETEIITPKGPTTW